MQAFLEPVGWADGSAWHRPKAPRDDLGDGVGLGKQRRQLRTDLDRAPVMTVLMEIQIVAAKGRNRADGADYRDLGSRAVRRR